MPRIRIHYGKIELKKDCFAYNELTGFCRCLVTNICAHDKCPFYKTAEEVAKK